MQIGSNDIERSAEFYRSYFGFRNCGTESGIIFLRDSKSFLLAIRKLEAPIELPPWLHMGVGLNDPQEVRNLYSRMKADGVRFSRDLDEGDGWVAFYCYDPGGHIVEVSWDRPDSKSC